MRACLKSLDVYVAIAKKRFMASMAYRFDHWTTIFGSVFFVFVFYELYASLYSGHTEIGGISLSKVATNLIISFILGDAYAMDDQFLRHKIDDGTIANEFLRPVNYKFSMLAEDIGQTAFNLIYRSGPALLVACIWFGVEPPKNGSCLIFSIFSFVLGFFVCWNLSFLVRTLAFWIINIWSISTIKNVFFNLFTGCVLPIWFLPDTLRYLISFTPFDSIYFGTVQIYLGMVDSSRTAIIFMKQGIWIMLLYLIGDQLWKRGKKKLVIQGG